MTKKSYDRTCIFCGKSPIRVSRIKPERCCTCGKLQKRVQEQTIKKGKKK